MFALRAGLSQASLAQAHAGGVKRKMNIKELTEIEFKTYFSSPMTNVTETAEEVVDLWAYAEPALKYQWAGDCTCELKVEHIYESPNGQWQHVLIPSHISNVYMVVVIDKANKTILGHHILDLGAKYGVQ